MQPSWRKPFGILAIFLLVGLWAMAVASAGPWINGLPTLVQTIVYLIAGTIWLLPLGPALRWMETGKFR